MELKRIKNSNWKKWLLIDIGIFILLNIIDFTVKIPSLTKSTLIITLVSLIIIFCLHLLKSKNKWLTGFTRWLSIVFLPFIMINLWISNLITVVKNFNSLEFLAIIIFSILSFLMYLPLIMVDVKNVHNIFGRLFTILIFMTCSYLIITYKIPGKSLWNTWIYSGLLGSIIFVISGCFLAYAWGFALNPNLKFTKSRNFNFWILGTLTLLAILMVIWHDFGGYGNNLLIIKIPKLKPTLFKFCKALAPGLQEEMVRYLSILIFLFSFRHLKNKLPLTIICSALIFGLLHLSNLDIHSLSSTLYQAITAFTLGLFLAVLYLYSGKLWLPVFIHFLLNYLLYIKAGSFQNIFWSGTSNDWLNLLLHLLVPTAITIWIMFGKRRQVMEENANRLILKTQN